MIEGFIKGEHIIKINTLSISHPLIFIIPYLPGSHLVGTQCRGALRSANHFLFFLSLLFGDWLLPYKVIIEEGKQGPVAVASESSFPHKKKKEKKKEKKKRRKQYDMQDEGPATAADAKKHNGNRHLSNSQKTNKKRSRAGGADDSEQQQQQQQQAYYDRLMHQCRKDLHKHCKMTRNFEIQKLVRTLKKEASSSSSSSHAPSKKQEIKLQQLKEFSAHEAVVQECFRRLGVLQLDPSSGDHKNNTLAQPSLVSPKGRTCQGAPCVVGWFRDINLTRTFGGPAKRCSRAFKWGR